MFIGETYYERIKDSKDPTKVRLKVLQYLFECKNISEVSKIFKVSRKTLRKWEARYYKSGIEGLKDRSKAPKSCPKKVSKDIENLIISIKTKYPKLGIRKIKKLLETDYNIHISIHPIYRILKTVKLI
ncbi:MAG: helix-turn-helix domain-containing protein [bacterium]|nr:helix-turn-helix domain-containing protein [bacterium]